jgi:hypothetical protein
MDMVMGPVGFDGATGAGAAVVEIEGVISRIVLCAARFARTDLRRYAQIIPDAPLDPLN